MGKGYREFEYQDHTADIKVVGYGNTIKKAFESLLLGVMNIIYDIDKVSIEYGLEKELENPIDIISTLYDFLTENLNTFYLENFAIADVKIKNLKRVKKGKKRVWYIRWKIFGERYDINKHGFKKEVKAITFNQMVVRKIKDGLWMATCVVDV